MVEVTEQSVAVVAPGRLGPSLVEVAGIANLDAVICLTACMELSNSASICPHHILTTNLANSAHQPTSSLLKKFFSATIFIDVVVPEPAIVLYSGQVESRVTLVLLVLDDDGLTFVVGTTTGQFLACK